MNKSNSGIILITGSSGFIGKHLTERLDSMQLSYIECDLKTGIDLLDLDSLMKLPKVDFVIHLAAVLSVVNSFDNPYEYYYNNYLSTLNILEYCRLKKVDKIVYAGSYVYGIPKYLPVDEKHPVDISNPYGRSKLFAEQLITAYCKDYDVNGVILRNFNIFGKGQNPLFLIPALIEQLFSESKYIEVSDLSPKRDFIYIRDFIEILLRSLRLEINNYEIFNVGTGIAYSVEQVIDVLFKVSGKRKKVICNSKIRKNEIPCTIADNSKIKKALRWEPKYTLENGMSDFIKSLGDKFA